MSPRLQVGFKEMNGSVLERDAQSVCSADSDNEMKDDDSSTGQLSDNEGSISIFKSFFIILISLKDGEGHIEGDEIWIQTPTTLVDDNFEQEANGLGLFFPLIPDRELISPYS